MPGRAPWSTPGSKGSTETVAVQRRPEISLNTHDTTTSLSSGSVELVEVYAADSEIWRVFENHVVIQNDGNATTGNMDFKVRFQNIDPFEAIGIQAPYTDKIVWDASHLNNRSAMNAANPTSDSLMASAFRDLRATASEPIKFRIENNLDVAHDERRRIYTLVEQEGY